MKVAFIALSGLRACDEELVALGLTFPGVLERSKQVAELPSLGLLTLAGMTTERHDVSYYEVSELGELEVLPGPFDLVAISGLTAQIKQGYAIADRYRALGAQVVMGGLHVTARPEEALLHADAVVVGEGEPVWPTILDHAERKKLLGIYDGKQSGFGLGSSPMPAYELLDLERYNRVTVQTSRGCPLACAFCASSIMLTSKYKQKPAERVLAEVDRIKELWRRPFLELADDNSFVNKKYWRELLPKLAKRRIHWFTETDISVGDAGNESFLDDLHHAGCVEVLIGLESPGAAHLGGIETRSDWKKKRQPRYLENIRRIQERGIRVNGCFIFGIDGQTREDFDDVYAFVHEAGLWDVQLTVLTPFPGTPLYDQLKREGRLTHDEEWERFTLFDLNFEPSTMDAEEMRQAFRELVVKVYDPDDQERRRSGFQHRRRRRFRSSYPTPSAGVYEGELVRPPVRRSSLPVVDQVS